MSTDYRYRDCTVMEIKEAHPTIFQRSSQELGETLTITQIYLFIIHLISFLNWETKQTLPPLSQTRREEKPLRSYAIWMLSM